MSSIVYVLMERIVFLDRDGTIIEEPEDECVNTIQKVRILPNTIPALKLLTDNNCTLFIITNQGDIGHGGLTLEQFHEINNYLLQQLENEGIRIEETFHCPHTSQSNCNCRKPKSGMLEAAAKKHGLPLTKSYVIGDREADIQVGNTVGSKTIFVLTGKDSPDESMELDFVARDLLDAAKYILNN